MRPRVLTVSHCDPGGVVGVGAYEVRGGRHVALDSPLEGLHGGVVRLGDDIVLAGLVLDEVVHRLPPRAVDLAHGGVAQLHRDGLVGRVSPSWEALVQTPFNRDFVFPSFYKTRRSIGSICLNL